MEKNCSNTVSSVLKEAGNYAVVINTVSPKPVNNDGNEVASILFTEHKSLENAVSIALSLKAVLRSNASRVYVVEDDSMETYFTTYTCVFDF